MSFFIHAACLMESQGPVKSLLADPGARWHRLHKSELGRTLKRSLPGLSYLGDAETATGAKPTIYPKSISCLKSPPSFSSMIILTLGRIVALNIKITQVRMMSKSMTAASGVAFKIHVCPNIHLDSTALPCLLTY